MGENLVSDVLAPLAERLKLSERALPLRDPIPPRLVDHKLDGGNSEPEIVREVF